MKESTKALRRRWIEHEQGVFPWRDLFRGFGIDVGSGDDPLPLKNCTYFDTPDGDANHLSEYFTGHEGLMNGYPFDFLHASQCLEHMANPVDALRDWLKVVAPGGHLIATIPDFDLYEKRCFPSRFNADHKAVFSLWRHGFPGVNGKLFNVPAMLAQIEGVEITLCRLVTTNFDWNAPEDIDQTFNEEKQVECWIEFVLLRK